MLLLTAAGSKGRRVRTGMPYLLCFGLDNIPAVFPLVKAFLSFFMRFSSTDRLFIPVTDQSAETVDIFCQRIPVIVMLIGMSKLAQL